MEFIVVALVIVALVAVAALVVMRQRSAALARRFGPEYERAVTDQGSRRAGESELRRLEQRRREIDLHDLDPETRARYAEEWRAAQLRFVDEPEAALAAADDLVAHVMADRGYPVDDLDDRVDMVVTDHPDLAKDYRAAHEVHLRADRGDAGLDDLRTGFQHYRALFDRLLGTEPDGDETGSRHDAAPAEPAGDAAADLGPSEAGDGEGERAPGREATVFDDAYGEVGPEPGRTGARDVR
jgi:hypothetical protein